ARPRDREDRKHPGSLDARGLRDRGLRKNLRLRDPFERRPRLRHQRPRLPGPPDPSPHQERLGPGPPSPNPGRRGGARPSRPVSPYVARDPVLPSFGEAAANPCPLGVCRIPPPVLAGSSCISTTTHPAPACPETPVRWYRWKLTFRSR